MSAGDDLVRRLAGVAAQLEASADDAALEPGACRSLLRDHAQVLRQLVVQAAALHQRLALARHGERRARRRADFDGLTRLPNRDGFDSSLSGALNAGDPASRMLAVFFLDLDRFKQVNDAHGHAVGDALLRAVAQRLRGAVRSGDLVCRLGGDEFACLVPGPMARSEIARLARKLVAAVALPFRLGTLELQVNASVGIAMYPNDGDHAATLLQRADAAMYRAKRQRSGLAFFEPQADAMPGRSQRPGTISTPTPR